MLTARYHDAVGFALRVHAAQLRKDSAIPYAAHVIAVSAAVLEHEGDEDMAIAGLLHDAVEDGGGARMLVQIRDRFGDRVAAIVAACSDSVVDTLAGERKPPWRDRKQAYLAHLATMQDRGVLIVSLCDKVHNARAILRDLRRPDIGAAVWSRFSAGREGTLWYYRALVETFRRVLPAPLVRELAEIVAAVEREA